MINIFPHGCSDHQDQLFCLFELKKASLALQIESYEFVFMHSVNVKSDTFLYTRGAQIITYLSYLLKRGCNRNFVTKHIQRATDIPRNLTLQTKDVNKPKRVPFITTFNPALPRICNI